MLTNYFFFTRNIQDASIVCEGGNPILAVVPVNEYSEDDSKQTDNKAPSIAFSKVSNLTKGANHLGYSPIPLDEL